MGRLLILKWCRAVSTLTVSTLELCQTLLVLCLHEILLLQIMFSDLICETTHATLNHRLGIWNKLFFERQGQAYMNDVSQLLFYVLCNDPSHQGPLVEREVNCFWLLLSYDCHCGNWLLPQAFRVRPQLFVINRCFVFCRWLPQLDYIFNNCKWMKISL